MASRWNIYCLCADAIHCTVTGELDIAGGLMHIADVAKRMAACLTEIVYVTLERCNFVIEIILLLTILRVLIQKSNSSNCISVQDHDNEKKYIFVTVQIE